MKRNAQQLKIFWGKFSWLDCGGGALLENPDWHQLMVKIKIEILEKYLVDEGHDYKIIGKEIHKPVKDKTSKSIQNLKKADIRYSKTFPIFLALSKYDHSYNPCHFRRF